VWCGYGEREGGGRQRWREGESEEDECTLRRERVRKEVHPMEGESEVAHPKEHAAGEKVVGWG